MDSAEARIEQALELLDDWWLNGQLKGSRRRLLALEKTLRGSEIVKPLPPESLRQKTGRPTRKAPARRRGSIPFSPDGECF